MINAKALTDEERLSGKRCSAFFHGAYNKHLLPEHSRHYLPASALTDLPDFDMRLDRDRVYMSIGDLVRNLMCFINSIFDNFGAIEAIHTRTCQRFTDPEGCAPNKG